MSNRKMCMNWDKGDCTKCPKNTNDYCEIVKPKERYKRVRAALTHIPKVGAETQMVTIDLKALKAGWIPCTILIDRKYLGGK